MSPGDLILYRPCRRRSKLAIVEVAAQLQRTDDHDGHEWARAARGKAYRLVGHGILAGHMTEGAVISKAKFIDQRWGNHVGIFKQSVPVLE